MALIDCPECSKRVSDQSISCPSCGYPIARAAPFRSVPPPLPRMDSVNNEASLLAKKPQVHKSKKKVKSYKLNDFFVVLLLIFLVYQLATCSDNETHEPSRVQNSTSNSGLTQIPMLISGTGEDGRYFLTSHTTQGGIEYVGYTRKGNESDSYSKMQIDCSNNKMKSYSAESTNALSSADMGDWYTPIPDWTDKDIFNFICN